MTQQQEHLWTDEQVAQLAVDGEKIWMMGNVGLRNVLFRQLEKLRASYETALAARDERIRELEAIREDLFNMTERDSQTKIDMGLQIRDLRQQLAEAQRYVPVADGYLRSDQEELFVDELALSIATNGVGMAIFAWPEEGKYFVCRLAGTAQEGGER